MNTLRRDRGFVGNGPVNATSRLVSYVGVTHVVNQVFYHRDTAGIRQYKRNCFFIVCDLLRQGWPMNIMPDIPFLNIHNPFTNERIIVYLDKHRRMSLDTKNYFVKQISHFV